MYSEIYTHGGLGKLPEKQFWPCQRVPLMTGLPCQSVQFHFLTTSQVEARTNLAPSLAKACAIPFPMPKPAPVMMAVFPSSFNFDHRAKAGVSLLPFTFSFFPLFMDGSKSDLESCKTGFRYLHCKGTDTISSQIRKIQSTFRLDKIGTTISSTL